MPSSAEEAVLGQTIDNRYRLQRIRLGGVFGVVFAADEYFGRTFVRPVHVKVSRHTGMTDVTAPHFFGESIRLAQWLAESGRAERRQLPAILNMGLLPAWNNSGFLVTQAVEGTPLLQWLPAGDRPDLTAQLAVFKELCRTLAAVHPLGVAHRELRPEAVVIDSNGSVQLLGLGLSTVAEPSAHLGTVAPELLAHLAPETFQPTSTGPGADVYGLGLILYQWLVGGGPHLTASWSSLRTFAEALRLKQQLIFTAPSVLRPEISGQAAWLDELVLRCVDADPRQRYRDAGQVLVALETCAAGGALPAVADPSPTTATPLQRHDDAGDALIREARRHLARGEAQQAIDRLDIHRPAEWAVVDRQGARVLRVLGQAYARHGDWRSARECLEQLRSVQREQPLLAPANYAAALTDLLRCYQQLGLTDLAEALKRETRQLPATTR